MFNLSNKSIKYSKPNNDLLLYRDLRNSMKLLPHHLARKIFFLLDKDNSLSSLSIINSILLNPLPLHLKKENMPLSKLSTSKESDLYKVKYSNFYAILDKLYLEMSLN